MRNTYVIARAFNRGLLLAGCALATGAAHSQTLNLPAVTAQSVAGTYTDLGSTGSAIATPDFDDSNSVAQSIGFSFTFGGTAFTQFVLNTNGYVKLGSTAPPTPYFSTTPLTVAGGPLKGAGTNLLVPFNTDLEAATTGGTEYRVATTGAAGSRVCTIQWKNVSDKGRAAFSNLIDKQFVNFSFQLKLYEGSNQVEFVYGPVVAAANLTSLYYQYAHVGLKGAGAGPVQVITVAKAGDSPWSVPVFQDGTYPDYTNGFIVAGNGITGGSAALPDAGRTYRFSPPVANDLAVRTLYSAEQLPAGQAFVYRAYLSNAGSTSVSGQTATLTLTGANPQTVSVTLPTLAAGASTMVRFPGVSFPSAGTTTATVSVPADGNNTNNTKTSATATTSGGGFFSYISSLPPSGATGMLLVPAAAYTSAFAVKYQARPATTLNVVRARLGTYADNVGSTVYGVIADTTGQVLAQSAPYQIQAGDLNTLHTFVLTTPVQVPAGSFLVGLAQVRATSNYPAPIAYQPEVPTQPGTYFTFGISTPSAPADILSTSLDVPNYRFMIDAGYNVALATTPPALAGTLSVYPNPSASGLFTLDVRGAGPGPLTLEVLNSLGQRVYAGTVRGEVASSLDLSGLASGLYHLQVRNGSAVSSRKVFVAK